MELFKAKEINNIITDCTDQSSAWQANEKQSLKQNSSQTEENILSILTWKFLVN